MSEPYDENLEPKCSFCGIKIDGAIRDSIHGKIPAYHRYTNCRQQMGSFKSKIAKLKASDDPKLVELALLSEKSVFIEKKPAKWWYEQLKLVTKKKNLPLITQ